MNRSPGEAVAPPVRVVAVIAMAAVVAFIAWFVVRDNGDASSTPSRAQAVAAGVKTLRALPAQAGHDVYWAGKRTGNTYELTQTKDGRIYIRYLPAGVSVGDNRSQFLTVGTYSVRHAYQNLVKLSSKGQPTTRLAGGGIAVPSKVDPRSVYLAYPHADLQVEVYDPSPARALSLVKSGRVAPVR